MILISPKGSREKKLGIFSRYVPLSVPYGIGALAGYLMMKGRRVEIIDDEVEPVTIELLRRRAENTVSPHIFGISCLTASIGRGYEIARMIRAAPDIRDSTIIFGGIHPTVMTDEVLNTGLADIVVRKEGEKVLDELYARIKRGDDYSDVRGISYTRNGTIVHNGEQDLLDLNELPTFPYDIFHRYSSRYTLGFITSSRGCPHGCIFCSQRSISGKFYRYRDPETVIREIELLYGKYRQKYITFQDDNFLPNKERTLRLCDLIYRRFGSEIVFDCQARADNVNDEVLTSMKKAGFRLIHVGIECASDRLLEIINKRETLEQSINGIRLIRKHGIGVSGTFILGLPTETSADRKAAFELAKSLQLDYVRFNNATPYPGTGLFEIAQSHGRFTPGQNYENLNACGSLAESPFRRNVLSFVPENVDEEELRLDIIKYNLFFSMRPLRAIKLLIRRVGPAGWFALPEKWYARPAEWYHLLGFISGIGVKFALIVLAIILFKLKRAIKGPAGSSTKKTGTAG